MRSAADYYGSGSGRLFLAVSRDAGSGLPADSCERRTECELVIQMYASRHIATSAKAEKTSPALCKLLYTVGHYL